ncbi:MAG TPA: diaminobutyrate--2-oxoglutarate transaminase, partial [Nitrospira sp.]|nr:diaminobutyrate--2-oxoglutarate transaminase [Nitrospira sp.]
MTVDINDMRKMFPAKTYAAVEERENNPYLERQAERESNARSYPRRLPLALSKAKGIYVQDTDGRTYIDCLAGAGALTLGH